MAKDSFYWIDNQKSSASIRMAEKYMVVLSRAQIQPG
jgi:hypothetical protein